VLSRAASTPPEGPARRRPRVALLLATVHVVLLLLPLGGIAALRLYESALLRQTESELIGQAALLAAAYRAALAPALGARLSSYGRDAPAALAIRAEAPRWRPRAATLDLAIDEVGPPPPEAIEAPAPADPAARSAGETILPIMRDAQVVTLAAFRVVDPAGVVVASTGEDLGRSHAALEEVRAALAGETVSRLRRRISDEPAPPLASLSRGSPLRVFVGMPVVDEGRILGAVLLSRTPRSLGETLHGKRREILVAALVLLAAMAALTILTTLGIVRPLARLLEQTRRAGEGRGAVRPLASPVTAEVAELSEGVARMARALEQRAEALRGFAAEASHALKTPLAGLRGALELLVDHAETMSVEERSRFLANVTLDVDRLERLVRRLLELARADAAAVTEERADAAAVAREVAERSRHGGAEITLEVPAEPLLVAASEEIVATVLGALVENALEHAPGARIRVAARPRADLDGRVEIVVEDDGAGVPAGDRERIFEPFYTTARARGGTGLGLAIVRASLARRGGTIELVPSARGACFRVTLPGVAATSSAGRSRTGT
jgi:signal transduction histidine kinase